MRATEHIFNAKQCYIIQTNILPTLKMINGSWRANPALVSILVSNLIAQLISFFLQHLLTLIENNLNLALPYKSIRLPLTLPVGSPCTFCPLSHQTKNSTAKLHLIFFRQSKKPKLSSPNNMVGPLAIPWNLLAVIFVCCFASSSAAPLSQSSSALAARCQFLCPLSLLCEIQQQTLLTAGCQIFLLLVQMLQGEVDD